MGEGTELDGYILHQCLGQGGMARVYRASPSGPQRDHEPADCMSIAIKIASPSFDLGSSVADSLSVPPAEPCDPKANENANSTVRFIARPNAPCCAKGVSFVTGSYSCRTVGWDNIPDVLWDEFTLLKATNSDLLPAAHNFAVREDACYYTMDYMQGPSLRRVLADKRLGRSERWLNPLRVLVKELAVLHERNPTFYHGDVKPENLIVSHSDRLRLIDPAMRRNTDYGFGMTLTPAYNPLGLTGPQADTFAVAAMIVELFLGRPPFLHVTQPLIEYCCGGLHAGMATEEKRQRISDHLRYDDARRGPAPASVVTG